MNDDYKTGSSVHRQLKRVIKEWGGNYDNLGFEESVYQMRESLCENPLPEEQMKKRRRCCWGDYALAAKRYDLFTDCQLESAWKYLARQKKMYRKYKLYVRIFACVKFLPGIRCETVEPGQVLYEFSGVPEVWAQKICQETADLLDTQLRLISRKEQEQLEQWERNPPVV